MSSASQLRRNMLLLEAGYADPQQSSSQKQIPTEQGEVQRVVAALQTAAGGKYKQLAQTMAAMQQIAQQTLALEQRLQGQAREQLADLFKAEDVAYTRVVETVKFILELTRDPNTVAQNAAALQQLEVDLAPELLKTLQTVKAHFAQVSGANKTESVTEEIPSIGRVFNWLKGRYQKFVWWGEEYDRKLKLLKNRTKTSYHEHALAESLHHPSTVANSLWHALSNADTELEPQDTQPHGSSITVKLGDAVFEVSVTQIS
jgi:hypothetical protein